MKVKVENYIKKTTNVEIPEFPVYLIYKGTHYFIQGSVKNPYFNRITDLRDILNIFESDSMKGVPEEILYKSSKLYYGKQFKEINL